MEAMESQWLPRFARKDYAPTGAVTPGRASVLRHPPTMTSVVLDGETMVIEPETASWAFLTPDEFELFGHLDGTLFGESSESVAGFVTDLYRRGLLTIDGHSAIDPTMLRDGHNSPETHLVELLMTERCNLACTYCLAGTSGKMPRMDRETALRAVDLAYAMTEAETLAFELSGGEPFLEFGLMRELVDHIHTLARLDGRPVAINVQTNCTLLDAERVAWLRDNDIQVGISLDGNPKSHDRSRPLLGGKGSFERVIRGIDLMQREDVAFGALVVLNRFNINDPEGLLEFLVENGITGFKLNPVAYLGTARDTWTDIGVTSEEALDFTRKAMELVATRGYPVVESNIRTMCEFLVSKRRSVRCLRGHCGAGDTFQAVSANGSIYPCGRSTQSPGLLLGSVHDESLVSLSEAGRRNLRIAEIRTRRPDSLADCRTCAFRQLCQSGCSAEAFERHGTVLHKTPQCHYFHEGYPWLMRWLAFDAGALAMLSHYEYFGPQGAVLCHRDHFPAREPAHAPASVSG